MQIETGVEERRWYLLHTHPKQEERAYRNLVARGVESLHVKLRARRLNEFTGVPTYITAPLFPGYIFASFNAREQLREIRFTRGVHNVVCFGNKAAVVHADIIDIIRARIDQNGFVKINSDVKPQDKVIINVGPLEDLIRIFEREVKGTERSMILLSAIAYLEPSCG